MTRSTASCRRGDRMTKRREFITLLGGAAAWPLAAGAQQRMRHIGVLVPGVANDPVWQARIGAFQQALALSGWIIGRNVRIDIRWATTDAAAIRREAEELAALAPDVTLAAGHSSAAPLLRSAGKGTNASERSDRHQRALTSNVESIERASH